MMKHCFTAKRRKTKCVYLCVLLGKLLAVRISWCRGEQPQTELWQRTLCSTAFRKPCPLMYKRLGDGLNLLQNTWLIVFFSLLLSTNELAAPPEVSGHCKNTLTSDLIFLWPEQSVWHVICGSGWLQWVLRWFCRYFSPNCWQGPRLLQLPPLTLSLAFPIFFAWRLNLSWATFPLAVNSHWLADWLDSHAASLWNLIGLLEMQEMAHMVT